MKYHLKLNTMSTVVHIVELPVKYGDQLGLEYPIGPLVEFNQKALKGFFEFQLLICFIII